MKKTVLLLLVAGLFVTSCNQSANKKNCTFTVDGVSFKMVFVQGGTFTMGATSEQSDNAESDERPVHRVTLDDYYIGEYEVTQALWQAVMGNNPSYFSGTGHGNYPVEHVSWNDIQSFLTALNAATASQRGNKKFALPTEAQWEFAARGGNKSRQYKYAGSDNIDAVAWYNDWYNKGLYTDSTHPVGQKQPNELGLYDMSGNVLEWCSDWYGSSYHSNLPSSNPAGPSIGSTRVLRGGSWYSDAMYCRVSFRYNGYPDGRNISLGFRLVLLP